MLMSIAGEPVFKLKVKSEWMAFIQSEMLQKMRRSDQLTFSLQSF
jgi:hypothetical protein